MLAAGKKWITREFDEEEAINIFHMKPPGFGDDPLTWDSEPDCAMPHGMAQEPAMKSWQYKIVTKASACV